MMRYLIIPLADNATSFCHYSASESTDLISAEALRAAIRFAMLENLYVQFVYPKQPLPDSIKELIDSIDHVKIVPCNIEDYEVLSGADVITIDSWHFLEKESFLKGKSYVLRTMMRDFVSNIHLLNNALRAADRVNIVIIDADVLKERDFADYEDSLKQLVPTIVGEYIKSHFVQLNILTDRLFVDGMNNCNAGVECITLAPNAKFYICPGFYFEGIESVGDLESGIIISNSRLYKLSHSPICRECDAYHCKRCIWLNKRLTREVNTPSHEQCVMSHIERKISRELLNTLRLLDSSFLPGKEILPLEYLDPFEKLLNNKNK